MSRATRKTKLDRAAGGEGSLDAALRGGSSGLYGIAEGRGPDSQKAISDILAGKRSTLEALVAGDPVHRSSTRQPVPDRPERSSSSTPNPPLAADPAAHPIRTIAELGALVRAARRRLHLSQQRFADLAGVGRRFVSELESGKSTLEAGLVLNCCLAAGIDILARPRNQ
jgi:y4mF family transcriptional regulator